MPDPLLPPDPTHDPPIPVPIPAPIVRDVANPPSVICEFCECRVTTARGQVLMRSDKGKAYLDQDLEITRLKREVADAKRETAALKESLQPLGSRGTF